MAEVITIVSAADPSIGQIPQNHLAALDVIRVTGSEEQKRLWFGRALCGYRLANAVSEAKGRHVGDFQTWLVPDGDGLRATGEKFYATCALFAHYHHIGARDAEGRMHLAIAARGAPGLTITDDWTGFGQRITGSGSTVLDDVPVHPFCVFDFAALFERPTAMGPFAQLMHAAVEQGIAEAALAETVRFVRNVSRPARDSGTDEARLDPYTITTVGEMKIRADASGALLDRAARFVDTAKAEPAEAKVATTESVLFVSSKLIELGGSSATLAAHGLDSYWRNVRTHTVHDTVRWKYKFIGDYWLNGIRPPRHGAI